MYYNVFGEKVSKRRYKEAQEAAKNRRELIAAGLTSRRDLFKMGLLTAATVALATLNPGPTDPPNAASGTDGSEVRAFAHQGPTNYPTLFPHANALSRYYKFRQVQFNTNQFSPNLPTQTIWGFDD